MSLEKALEANTIALQNLTQVVQDLVDVTAKADLANATTKAEGATLPKATAAAAAEIGKAAVAAGKAAEKAAQVEVKEDGSKPDGGETPDDPTKRVWTYDELAKDFLALLKSNRPAAMAVLESMKIASLKDIKGKEVYYSAVAAKLEEARNG